MDKVTHYVMNVDYESQRDDRASSRAEALIIMLNRPDATGSRILLQRGFRYEDEFVRQNGRWLISKRTVIPLWMTKSETVPVDCSPGNEITLQQIASYRTVGRHVRESGRSSL
jgi:hypothetical protein